MPALTIAAPRSTPSARHSATVRPYRSFAFASQVMVRPLTSSSMTAFPARHPAVSTGLLKVHDAHAVVQEQPICEDQEPVWAPPHDCSHRSVPGYALPKTT